MANLKSKSKPSGKTKTGLLRAKVIEAEKLLAACRVDVRHAKAIFKEAKRNLKGAKQSVKTARNALKIEWSASVRNR